VQRNVSECLAHHVTFIFVDISTSDSKTFLCVYMDKHFLRLSFLFRFIWIIMFYWCIYLPIYWTGYTACSFCLKTTYMCSYINTNTTNHCFKIRDSAFELSVTINALIKWDWLFCPFSFGHRRKNTEQQMVMQSGYMEELEVSMYFIDV
jgi:hypothetical protein